MNREHNLSIAFWVQTFHVSVPLSAQLVFAMIHPSYRSLVRHLRHNWRYILDSSEVKLPLQTHIFDLKAEAKIKLRKIGFKIMHRQLSHWDYIK